MLIVLNFLAGNVPFLCCALFAVLFFAVLYLYDTINLLFYYRLCTLEVLGKPYHYNVLSNVYTLSMGRAQTGNYVAFLPHLTRTLPPGFRPPRHTFLIWYVHRGGCMVALLPTNHAIVGWYVGIKMNASINVLRVKLNYQMNAGHCGRAFASCVVSPTFSPIRGTCSYNHLDQNCHLTHT